MAEHRECGGAGDICLKLGFLIIVYGVILYHNRKSSIIDNRYIHLVDDLALFERFPWGRLAYDHLVESTHDARDSLSRFISSGIRSYVDAPSYSYALQVWDYEVMPSVGRLYATRILDW
ncbi:hypothetical protein C2S53_008732 [Perilla frutescens var. hirtella]|uniref:DUF1985 domain-containing protein n=1 Tax=Perilla frutescens var. hirtella TaxID=608512 RepID=A0AAD4J1M3_PERFH|nr:hypothetical protein C2S53_008732 [Perilla frutescens var. hirtella]